MKEQDTAFPPLEPEDKEKIKDALADWQADVSLSQSSEQSREQRESQCDKSLATWLKDQPTDPNSKTTPPPPSTTALNKAEQDKKPDSQNSQNEGQTEAQSIEAQEEQEKPTSAPTEWQADVSLHHEEETAEADEAAEITDEASEEEAGPLADWQTEPAQEPAVKKAKKQKTVLPPLTRKVISVEGFVTIGAILLIFIPIGVIMGMSNMMQTLFNNGLNLLINTCFYLLAVSVIIGALSSVLSEFGTVSIFNKALAPLMKPLYGMPGATSMAMFSSFMSDNPAVLTLVSDRKYRRYFKKYQLATLTNAGTSFGMGLIVIALMMTVKTGEGSVPLAIAMGVVGTFVGSIITTRLMLRKAKKMFGTTEQAEPSNDNTSELYREIREGGIGQRFISSLLDGGSEGVKTGFSIIPGVLIIANLILLLTNGKPIDPETHALLDYNGGAGQGVALIPFLGEQLNFLFKYLFGFSDPSAISIPLTALGSAGAAIGILTGGTGAVYTANELAVFTAMCMFWSGYLSTHVSMMDTMGFRKLTGWSIIYHTIAGLAAGVVANYLYQLCALLL